MQSEAIESLASEFHLTETERNELVRSQTKTKIKDRTSWAKTYLVKAGLLQVPRRGYCTITERGKSVLDSNVSTININFLKKYPEFNDFRTLRRDNASLENFSSLSESSLTSEENIHFNPRKLWSQTPCPKIEIHCLKHQGDPA
ncbi:MAG: winged helix-turn-helix domain-containing protein [Desulfovibrio sp.]|nr:winged helix-turn-helix domain-containing protein [Desulfovibrio sp.]